MKIAICSSLDFTNELKDIAEKLKNMGFDLHIPPTSKLIIEGKLTVEDIKKEKASGTFSGRAVESDAIRRYWKVIKDVDAILLTNYEKKGIKGYIGGNSFLEMGFTHVLNKKIFLLNEIPEMSYTDEIKAMQPVVLNGNLTLIK